MRKLILTSVSVMALGLAAAGGYAQSTTPSSTGLPTDKSAPSATTPGAMGNSSAAMPSTAAIPDKSVMPSTAAIPDKSAMQSGPRVSHETQAPSRDMIRQAQEQLRSQGLYKGHIDGRLGHGTRQALSRFQSKNGLHRTATLDQSTMDKLVGNSGSVGSSTAPVHQQSIGRTPQTVPPGPGSSTLGR
jgi:peptidoglycan hydrolase-like protein with peptidoglycan-binding domain